MLEINPQTILVTAWLHMHSWPLPTESGDLIIVSSRVPCDTHSTHCDAT